MSFVFNIYQKDGSLMLANQETAEQTLNFLESNPYGEVTEMEIDGNENWVQYNRQEIIKELKANKTVGIGILIESPIYSWGAIGQNFDGNGFFFEVEKDDVSKINLEEVKEYMKKRGGFPKFSHSTATADDRNNEFWMDVAKTAPLPECFGSRLGWFHVISPKGYANYFKREDLLKAPAFHIEELTDGTICFQSYEHPLDFSNEKTTQQIIELTNYLYHKWGEHDPDYGSIVEIEDDVVTIYRKF